MRIAPFILALTALPSAAQTFTQANGVFEEGPDASLLVFGASWADANRDGLPDFYHTGRLYLQRQGGTLRNVLTQPRFETGDGSSVFGGVFADPDGDGFLDLFVEDFDPGSRFFRSRYGIRWDLANDATGLDMSGAQSQGVAWGDYDADGDLDLFVGEEFGGNRLFENLGNGVFQNAGLTAIQNDRHSYGVAAADYDRDGDLDVFIAACFSGDPALSVNALFRNEGDGTFVDVATQAGVADSLAGWATVWLDYDRDTWPDLFVANMPIYGPDARPGFNKLYRNKGDGTFEDVSEIAGVVGGPDDWGFGASTADFDNDGWEDIWLANDPLGIGAPHQLFRNMGDGTFQDVMPGLGLLPIDGSIGIAAVDFNADGWIDVATASREGNRLFLNDGGGARFLSVRLRGPEGNRDGVGARISAYLDGVTLVRRVSAGDGMTSQNHDLSVHFGLGSTAVVDSLVIEWPDGAVSVEYQVDADQHLYLTRSGSNRPPSSPILGDPPNASQVQDQALFSWTGSTDPDGDPVTYTLAILSLDDRSEAGEIVLEGLTATEATPDLGSLADGDYVWTVVAEDGIWRRAASEAGSFRKAFATDVTAVPNAAGLELFPNPVSDVLFLRGGARGTLDVVDVLGRRVLSVEHDGASGTLELGHLAPGLYMIRDRISPQRGRPFLKAD